MCPLPGTPGPGLPTCVPGLRPSSGFSWPPAQRVGTSKLFLSSEYKQLLRFLTPIQTTSPVPRTASARYRTGTFSPFRGNLASTHRAVASSCALCPPPEPSPRKATALQRPRLEISLEICVAKNRAPQLEASCISPSLLGTVWFKFVQPKFHLSEIMKYCRRAASKSPTSYNCLELLNDLISFQKMWDIKRL